MKKILEQELVAGIRKNDPAAKETMYRMYRDEFIGWSFKTQDRGSFRWILCFSC